MDSGKATALHIVFFYDRKIEKSLDNSGIGEMLLTDLSKAFDFLKHDLLIAKLGASGFDQPSLCLIFSYFSVRTWRAKVNNAYSSYNNIKYGVPQGSILGALFLILIFVILIFVPRISTKDAPS